MISVAWHPRPSPLEACAVAASGVAARTLALRCLARDDEQLAALRGVSVGRDGLILLGDFGVLPWADGALYLGRDDQAPSLLLPTTLQPDAPLALFERTLLHQLQTAPQPDNANAQTPPLAVWPSQNAVVSLSQARPLDRARLQTWLDAALAESAPSTS